MLLTKRLLAASLAAALLTTTASAIPVTAFFTGFVVDINEAPVTDGEAVDFRISGDTEAAGLSADILPLELSGSGTAAVYDIDILSFSSASASGSAIGGQFYVIDDYSDDEISGDVLAAFGSTGSTTVQYAALFSGDTFSGTSLGTAISLGLQSADPELQLGQLISGDTTTTASIELSEIIFGEGEPGGGGASGGGGNSGGGSTPPDLATVPLPASALLLIAGVFGLGFLRRFKSA